MQTRVKNLNVFIVFKIKFLLVRLNSKNDNLNTPVQ